MSRYRSQVAEEPRERSDHNVNASQSDVQEKQKEKLKLSSWYDRREMTHLVVVPPDTVVDPRTMMLTTSADSFEISLTSIFLTHF